MKTNGKHGLTLRQIGIIKEILAPYSSRITRVDLFGSRAVGNYDEHSDIDMVLHGNVDEKTIDRLWTLFHESSLPYKVDVKHYESIKYSPLKRHIDKVCLTLLRREDLLGEN